MEAGQVERPLWGNPRAPCGRPTQTRNHLERKVALIGKPCGEMIQMAHAGKDALAAIGKALGKQFLQTRIVATCRKNGGLLLRGPLKSAAGIPSLGPMLQVHIRLQGIGTHFNHHSRFATFRSPAHICPMSAGVSFRLSIGRQIRPWFFRSDSRFFGFVTQTQLEDIANHFRIHPYCHRNGSAGRI